MRRQPTEHKGTKSAEACPPGVSRLPRQTVPPTPATMVKAVTASSMPP